MSRRQGKKCMRENSAIAIALMPHLQFDYITRGMWLTTPILNPSLVLRTSDMLETLSEVLNMPIRLAGFKIRYHMK